MKKRFFTGMIFCLMVLCMSILPVFAETDDSVSFELSDMVLSGNCGSNYVRGNGMRHSPARAWLYANEKGGVTLVQYVSANTGVTVAEFDGELNFINTRSILVEGIKNWGGFYAGKTYNYIVYSTGSNVLRIDQYNKDWAFLNTNTYELGNTNSLISNDLDITEGGGSLFIVSNHTMTSGHQANFRLQISAETLVLQVEQTGTASYHGYCSHSYVPEVVYSSGTLYTFDRSDSVPGKAIYMNVFGGSLNTGSGTRTVKSMLFNDWGSQGNAIPAANSGVLTAYTFASWDQKNTATDVYLYYASPSSYGTQTRVSYTGGAGTPYVMAITDTYGYVLWNTDLYDNTQAEDNLYYAVYTLNSGNITVGSVRKAEKNYLSDCEPIQWNDGLLWFTYGSKELSFHQIDANGKVSKKINHNPVTVPGKAATCTSSGLTDGEKCSFCGEVFVEQEVIEMIPHTEEAIYITSADCTQSGRTDGVQCAICNLIIKEPENIIEPLSHTEIEVPGTPATCTATGLTAGKQCSVCGTVTVEQEFIEMLPHVEVKTDYVAPTFTTVGYTEGTKCEICEEQLSGHEVIPKLKAAVEGIQLDGNTLNVDYQSAQTAFVTVAFFNDLRQCVGVQVNTVFSGANTAVFTLLEESRSYRIFITDVFWIPQCNTYEGLL